MKTWTIDDAQSHFAEILESSAQEPQIIADEGEPVAALVDIALFNELMAAQPELNEIQAEEKQGQPASLKEELLRIGQECASLPLLDNRSPEEILGYNEIGVTA